jgi:transcriptional regulator GlxA family with amidase domain
MTVSLSPRQLERLFRRHFDCTPGQYYLKLRLETARDLLRRTNRAVLDVAIACGFASTSHFTKCYRERYNCTPTEERQSYFWAQGGRKPARAAVAPARAVTAP